MGTEETKQEQEHKDFMEETAYYAEEDNIVSEAVDVTHVAKNKKRSSHIPGGREVAKVDKILVQTSDDVVSEVKERIKQYIEKDANGKFRCSVCGKEAVGEAKNAKTNLEKHVETHLEGLSFPCQLCGKTFRSRHSFNNHKYKFHG